MYKLILYNENQEVLSEEVENLPNRFQRMQISKANKIHCYDRFKITTGTEKLVIDSNYYPDIMIVGGFEFDNREGGESGGQNIQLKNILIVIKETHLWDALTNKGFGKKIAVANLIPGDTLILYDQQISKIPSNLIGVMKESNGQIGYVDKDSIYETKQDQNET